MKIPMITGISLAAVGMVLLPVSIASAKAPHPSPVAPTASEFAAIPPTLRVRPGATVPIPSDQKTLQAEIAELTREGQASAVAVDVSTGKVIWVSELPNARSDPTK